MKRIQIFLFFIFFGTGLFAQKKPESTYIKTQRFKNSEGLRLGAVQNYFYDIQEKQEKKPNYIFNEKLLNLLFASEVGRYLTDSKNLTLQKAYAVISTGDNQIFLGTSVDPRESELDRLRTLWTLGLKAKLSNDFSTLVKNGNPVGEVGLNFKFTRIGKGIINYGENRERIITYRDEILKEKYQEKVEKYLDGDFQQDNKVLEKIYLKSPYKNFNKKYIKLLEKKAADIYKEMAEDEINFIKKQNLYNYFWNHWWTIEASIPLTEKRYKLIPDTLNTNVAKENFMPFTLQTGYTHFWHFSDNSTLYLSVFGSIFNNNNIEIEKLKSFTLTSSVQGMDDLIKESQEVYAGDFETFLTKTLKFEGIHYFLLEGKAGLSAALEKNFGDYRATNWKLGLPISLRDKDDKPTVNLELQWKEVNGDHFVGIGVGYAFGKFIN